MLSSRSDLSFSHCLYIKHILENQRKYVCMLLSKYLLSKNGDTDIETRVVDMGREEEGEGGMNGDSIMEA